MFATNLSNYDINTMLDEPINLMSPVSAATTPIDVLHKFKLSVFPPGHFGPGIEEDILLNEEDFVCVKVGDILEIGQTDEDERPKLLLMARYFSSCGH